MMYYGASAVCPVGAFRVPPTPWVHTPFPPTLWVLWVIGSWI